MKRLMLLLLFIMVSISSYAQLTGPGYSLTPELITHRVEPEVIITESIDITNTKATAITLELDIKGPLENVSSFEESTLRIASGETKTATLNLYAPTNATTFEDVVLVRGDISADIPLSLTVFSEEIEAFGTLMIELKVLEDRVPNGRTLNYVVDLLNLIAENEFDIELHHRIQRLDDEDAEANFWEMNESISMQYSESLLRTFEVPKEFVMGDYSLTIDATYLNFTSTVKGLFIVERPIYAKKVGGIMPVWSLITILSFGVMAYLLYSFIKHQQEKKKRFHVTVNYKLIPGEGERNIFIGNIAETKHKCYLDMDNLTVHSIVAGSTGGGKSIAAQDIVESCLDKGVAVAVFDPTAQWSGMLRKLADKKFLGFYPKFDMDPKKDAKAYPGNIKAIKNHLELVDIFKYLKAGEIQVFTTNTLDPRNYDTFVANMIRQIFHSKLEEFRGLKYLVVFDEIHRILPKFGGTGEGFTQIERGCREFRKWGIGIVLISQVLSDFVGEIKANINTAVQMKTRDDGDLNRIKTQYGDEFVQGLVKAPVGSGMVQNAAYNGGKPFYVTFRPIKHSVVRLTDEELDLYNQYNDVIEDLEYQFDQLEELKQDVFDLRLELKLSKDKVKAGNFNMVKIYLDGLTPRVQKVWDKLGKKPKKLEIKLVSQDEMKAEFEAAQKAKAEAKAKEAPAEEKKEEEEPDVEMAPEEIEENMNATKKLFEDVDELIKNKDFISVNDRLIEVVNIPLPKDKKKEVKAKAEEYKKKVEELKAAK